MTLWALWGQCAGFCPAGGGRSLGEVLQATYKSPFVEDLIDFLSCVAVCVNVCMCCCNTIVSLRYVFNYSELAA